MPPHAIRSARLAVALVAIGAAISAARGEDIRLRPPKDLDGYFPFQPPATREAWDARREEVRRRILVAQGLWPEPTREALAPSIHGTITKGPGAVGNEGAAGYTVSRVSFQSLPGLYVTGNLYRPVGLKEGQRVPAVLFAHGHWKDARLSEQDPAALRREIAAGEERFEQGGRSRFQSLCVQAARMGCVVWQWDMLSDSDAVQFSRELVHGFAVQRPEMNTVSRWGLYSPQAESHLQSIMGLQTWNGIRSVDFVLSLPEVDPARIAVTGASGGGTQTMLLAAVDPRIALSGPMVMVSTAMQGGCTCENASLLRIGTGNVEFAALCAPRPQIMNTADDWTKELATKGFPDLQALYALTGAKDAVALQRGEHFPHNYNAVSRAAFYTFLNRHFALGQPEPVVERDYEPLSREHLTVWDADHPAPPAADPEFERSLLERLTVDSDTRLTAAVATDAGLRDILRPAWATVIGRTYGTAGDVEWRMRDKTTIGDAVRMTGTLVNTTHGEEVAVAWLHPRTWNGRVVVWLDDDGTGAMADPAGPPAVLRDLVAAGTTVVAVDPFSPPSEEGRQRVVKNPRQFAGYTYGYNHALFAQRAHDILTVIRFLRTAKVGDHPAPTSVALVGLGSRGPVAAAARAVAGAALDRAAIDTAGFRFGTLLDYRDPAFLPGAGKYLDLPGLLAAGMPGALWLAGEATIPEPVSAAAKASGVEAAVLRFAGERADAPADAARWVNR